jgi:hypothetical protein
VLSPLEEIWIRAGLRDGVVTYDETQRWPGPVRELVFSLPLLRRVEDAECLDCDACGESHWEDVEIIGDEEDYAVIPCPTVGLLHVSPERLQRWEVDLGTVVTLLAEAFDLGGTSQELKSARAWLLGNRRLAGRLTEFFFVLGADWRDGLEILQTTPRLDNSPAPVVLFPGGLPEDLAWRANGRALYSLRELVRLGDSRLVASLDPLEGLHSQIAARLGESIVPTPVEKRTSLLLDYCGRNSLRLKDICWSASVHRQDLNAWKLGKPGVPDGGERASRIEQLLQFGVRARA